MTKPDWKSVTWYKGPDEAPETLLTRVSSYVALVIFGGLLGAVGAHVFYWWLFRHEDMSASQEEAFWRGFVGNFWARSAAGAVLGAGAIVAYFIRAMGRETQLRQRVKQSQAIGELRKETATRRQQRSNDETR